MSRSAGDPRVRRPPSPCRRGTVALAAPWLLLLILAAAPASAAARAAPEATPTILSSQQVRYSLWRLQEGWLQWTPALFSGDEEQALGVIEGLEDVVRRLGMHGVPDLSAGALVQAVDAARDGEPEQAALALEAAERLAPGRPETEFAAAEVARLAGDWPGMLVAEARGYARLPRTVLERRLAVYDLALWAIASVLLAAALFVVLEMAVRGPAVARDLGRAAGARFRRLGSGALTVLVALLLLWPLALPAGPLWLVLYWSFLLWGSTGTRERAVFVFAWFAVAAAPTLVAEIDERVAVALSPPVRAMENVARGDLYGGLFTDLGVLPATLPEEPAVDHFIADLHLRLGQWEEARRHYQRVLEAEPENVSALVNLGAYYYYREDLGDAVEYLRRAAETESAGRAERAAAWFDLSQAYTDSNLFDEQREAFAEARRVDDALVNEWSDRPDDRKVVTVEGGIERVEELERALRDRRGSSAVSSPTLAVLRRARSAILVLVLAIAAISSHAVIRSRRREPAGGTNGDEPGRWLAVLVPGLRSVRAEHGVRAFGALLVVVAPVLVLLHGRGGLGYRLPWRHDPGGWLLPTLAVLALALVAATRIVRSRDAAPGTRRGG